MPVNSIHWGASKRESEVTKIFACVWLLARDGSVKRNISGWLPEALKAMTSNDLQSLISLDRTNNPVLDERSVILALTLVLEQEACRSGLTASQFACSVRTGFLGG